MDSTVPAGKVLHVRNPSAFQRGQGLSGRAPPLTQSLKPLPQHESYPPIN